MKSLLILLTASYLFPNICFAQSQFVCNGVFTICSEERLSGAAVQTRSKKSLKAAVLAIDSAFEGTTDILNACDIKNVIKGKKNTPNSMGWIIQRKDSKSTKNFSSPKTKGDYLSIKDDWIKFYPKCINQTVCFYQCESHPIK